MTNAIFIAVIYFFSIVMHEVAHGLVAYGLGDPTAKNAGRLTLNPVSHIDPFGTILLPLIMAIPAFFGATPIIFGWAKPVPFNPMYFKDIRSGTFLVAGAGVFVNFLMAIIFSMILRYAVPALGTSLSSEAKSNLIFIFSAIVFANLALGIFNLFPIPPLDGSKLLFSILPRSAFPTIAFLEHYGIFILLLILFLAPGVLSILVGGAFHLLVGG